MAESEVVPTPVEDTRQAPAVPAGDTPLASTEMADIVNELRDQPGWRRAANEEDDYYDGHQLDAETLHQMRELGLAPLTENLIRPTIDSVLGLEARMRRDWRVTPSRDDKFKDMAEAMNVRLNEAEKESRADRARSDAYKFQINSGFGCLEVSREDDPFKYPYCVKPVKRNEIFWDWASAEPDWSDARYVVRKRSFFANVVALKFPKHAELLRSIAGGQDDLYLESNYSTDLGGANDVARAWPYDEEWRDVVNRRVTLYEVWYRRWTTGIVLKLKDSRVVEYEPQNPAHIEALAFGLAAAKQATYSKVRQAWFVGPYGLEDRATPYKHNRFPYVPFWGYREGNTGVPYGLTRAMRPLQDEINARLTKMVFLLSARRIEMTEGVTVDDPETVRAEVMRPDGTVVLDPQKLQSGGMFKVHDNVALNQQQYQRLVDAREALQNVGGVHAAFQGRGGDANSGVALQTLVEQSTQALAEINDNYGFASSLVGELLLSLIIEDMGDEPQQIHVDRDGKPRKTVDINQRYQLDDGTEGITNSIQQAMLKVSLSDVPATSSYRAQRLQVLSDITKSLPPEIQALVIDFVIASTDLPERDIIVERIRNRLNLVDGESNGLPRTPAELQQLIQQHVQQAMQRAGAEFKEREIAVREFDAETKRIAVLNKDEKDTLDAALRAEQQADNRFSQAAAIAAKPPANPPTASQRYGYPQ